jgi:DNA-directed RNA polymerase specialized sigma24 family protein
MTKAEFDTWIGEHYGELVAVAKRRSQTDEDAAEAVQNAIAQTLASGRLAGVRSPWTWMVNAVRGTAANIRRGNARTAAARTDFKRATRAGLHQGWKRPAPRAE